MWHPNCNASPEEDQLQRRTMYAPCINHEVPWRTRDGTSIQKRAGGRGGEQESSVTAWMEDSGVEGSGSPADGGLCGSASGLWISEMEIGPAPDF